MGTFSELLNASVRAVDAGALAHQGKVAGAIDADTAGMVAFLLTTVFPGQNPMESAADHMSIMLARARLGSTNWTAPASNRVPARPPARARTEKDFCIDNLLVRNSTCVN